MASCQLGEDEIVRILGAQNPWQRTGLVPDALAPAIERTLAQELWKVVSSSSPPRRAHVILGPRRVGKTTVMYQTVRHLLEDDIPSDRIWWLRMHHPFLMNQPLGRLIERVQRTSGAAPNEEIYVFLDELVYAADWDLWLKTFHDEHWPVRIIASSSATAALRGRHLESGVGRWDEHLLCPISSLSIST